MHPDHRETKQTFANEVAIADCIETILADASKSEFACDQFAIKDDAGTGERAGAERQNVSSFQTIIKAFEIARERFDLAQQIVREQNRLGALQMRVAGHNKIDMLFGEIDERCLQFLEQMEEHTSELQSQSNLVCRLLLEKKNDHHLARLPRV